MWESSQTRARTHVSCIGRGFLTTAPLRKSQFSHFFILRFVHWWERTRVKGFSPSSVTGSLYDFTFSGVLTCCHGFPCMDMFPFWAAFPLAWCGQDPADASRMADSEKLLPGTVETRNSAWEAVSDVCLCPMPSRTSSSWGSWRSGWNRVYFFFFLNRVYLLPQDIPLYSKSTVGYYLERCFYKINTLAVVPQLFPSKDLGILFKTIK